MNEDLKGILLRLLESQLKTEIWTRAMAEKAGVEYWTVEDDLAEAERRAEARWEK